MARDGDEWLVHGERRRALKGVYRDLYLETSAILFRHDPIGLDFETNVDEYDPEVDRILPNLRACKSADEVQHVVHQAFVTMFDADLAGPSDRYRLASLEIWDLWRRLKPDLDA